jgi:transposase
MARPAKYPEEFRREAVELARTSGRDSEVARDLRWQPGVWIKAAEAQETLGALDADERAELERLRRENKDLRMDREIRRTAAA